jgi:type IV pilus assembly protein PilP
MNLALSRFSGLGLAIGLFACGGSPPPPSKAAAPAKQAESAVAASDAGVADQAPYVYSYSPLGKRDPFRSPLGEMTASQEGGGTGCGEPLCQWDLDQLKLVAVVTGDANPIAMVEDPQTRGYIIHRGTRVGKQGGQVTQILRDAVTVTQYFTAPDGKRTPNTVPLRLKPDSQTVPAQDLNTGKTFP